MSNIIKLAPYAYLAKRIESGTLYDLLLLVSADASGDTYLSTVNPVKQGGTRITIDYAISTSPANVPYRFEHWQIDNEDTYVDIEIQGDNNAERTTVLTFADADNQQATVSSQMQTCAPYLFSKIETVGMVQYIRPS